MRRCFQLEFSVFGGGHDFIHMSNDFNEDLNGSIIELIEVKYQFFFN